MTKFSSEFRKKVVLEYLTGYAGSKNLVKKHGIKSHETILKWVHAYEKYGIEAFDIRTTDQDYNGKFKLEVLEWKKRNYASLNETCLHFDISTTSTVWSWERKFSAEGVEALFQKRGRSKKMVKKVESDTNRSEEDKLSDLEKLKYENRLLRIENEYLKN